MPRRRLLVVDDEEATRDLIRDAFADLDFDISEAANGDEALTLLEKELFDLVLLDIMMPTIDGFTVLRRLRQFSNVPVIMLTGRIDEADKDEAGRLGADDYVAKPFTIKVLIGSIQDVLGRGPRPALSGANGSTTAKMPSLDDGYLKIDFARRLTFVNGQQIRLPPKEYSLLQEFAANAGTVLTYDRLLCDLWGDEFRDATDILHDHVNRLRRAIEPDPHIPRYIVNIPKTGYRFGAGSRFSRYCLSLVSSAGQAPIGNPGPGRGSPAAEYCWLATHSPSREKHENLSIDSASFGAGCHDFLQYLPLAKRKSGERKFQEELWSRFFPATSQPERNMGRTDKRYVVDIQSPTRSVGLLDTAAVAGTQFTVPAASLRHMKPSARFFRGGLDHTVRRCYIQKSESLKRLHVRWYACSLRVPCAN